MVRTRGNVANNAPPEGGAETTQNLDEIRASLLDTTDHLVVLEWQVIGNEEDDEAGNFNQQPPEDNPDMGVDNNAGNAPVQPENKKA
ncbi:hypothetical protein KI387_011980, partial [Taxus chinensis]